MTESSASTPRRSPRRAEPDRIWAHALACVEAALDKKALDPVILDVRGQTQLADYFLLFTGRSDTQVRAIAEAIEERCRQIGRRPLCIEGTRHGQWILLDYGDFVVHVFYAPVRELYDLERLWSGAIRCPLPAALLKRHPDALAATSLPS
jgi:ribosome-associated protein